MNTLHDQAKQNKIKQELISGVKRVKKTFQDNDVLTQLTIAGGIENKLTQLIACNIKPKETYYHPQRSVKFIGGSRIQTDLANLTLPFNSDNTTPVNYIVEAKHTLTSQRPTWVVGSICKEIHKRKVDYNESKQCLNRNLYMLYYLTEITCFNVSLLHLVQNDFVKQLKIKNGVYTLKKHIAFHDDYHNAIELNDNNYNRKYHYVKIQTKEWKGFQANIHVFVLGVFDLGE